MELGTPVTTSIVLHHFTSWARYEEVSLTNFYSTGVCAVNGSTKYPHRAPAHGVRVIVRE